MVLADLDRADRRAHYRLMLLIRIYDDLCEIAPQMPKAAALVRKIDAMLGKEQADRKAYLDDLIRDQRATKVRERRRGLKLIE